MALWAAQNEGCPDPMTRRPRLVEWAVSTPASGDECARSFRRRGTDDDAVAVTVDHLRTMAGQS
jgi:hypothetical protein